ncbi:MAG: 5'-methylthioadenosine/S-adenosylhomocysteine nucleosidase [Lentilitoribacter sp.]
MTFLLKQIGDKKILFVMAAQPEYGVALQSRIKPLMCGVGPVEAAIVVTAVLTELKLSEKLPDIVVSLGSAGSRTLEQTGVYQAKSVSYRDMDASALGFEKGTTPLLDLPKELTMPVTMEGVPAVRLSTGANVVSGDAYNEIDADMVDMETFAILRACHRFDVPLLALRGISDGKDELDKLEDWTEYLHIIDVKLAETIDILGENILSDSLVFNN